MYVSGWPLIAAASDGWIMTQSTKEAGMEAMDVTLCERVDQIICSHKGVGAQPLLATTTTHAAIHELIRRSEGLEEAVREIALDVQKLETAQERKPALVA
jgi:hypothetical protein